MSASEQHNQQPDGSPILLIPFMWVGDFVRCHSVVQILRQRFPNRPIDILSSRLCAPLTRLMPDVRDAVVCDLPRGQIAFGRRRLLAADLRARQYGSAFMMLGTFKDAIAPWLAGIPERVGWVGEWRYLLLTDSRSGEKNIHSLAERCVALALPKGTAPPANIPPPKLAVPAATANAWRRANNVPDDGRPIIALAPGCNHPARTWPIEKFAGLAKRFSDIGAHIFVLGGPAEIPLAQRIADEAGDRIFDFTGTDLYDAAIQSAAADLVISNDSGLLHVGAATGTPALAIYGAGEHKRTGPLNANVEEISLTLDCRPCFRETCPLIHLNCLNGLTVEMVFERAQRILSDHPRR